jgi:zinc transport system substrate-binding protein
MSINRPSLVLAALLLAGCTAAPSEERRLSVVASIYPLAELTQEASQGLFTVETIVPGGTEPHDFEPTPRDIAAMLEADVLVLNGAGMDEWALKTADEARAKGAKVILMRDAITFLEAADHEEEHEEEEGHDDEGHEDHGPLDPHFWLDPQKASAASLQIANVLGQADPENATQYLEAASSYERELLALDDEYAKGLASCGSRSAIVSHDAFNYLAARHNLVLHAIAGLSTEEEPSAKQMGALVDLARRENIGVIFFESLASPRLAQTLASELNVRVLPLNPLEGLTAEQAASGADYLSVMRENLQNLRLGLQCP